MKLYRDYRYLAKQVYRDQNSHPRPDTIYRNERRARERAIAAFKRLLFIVERLGDIQRINEEACKDNPKGLPF
jgi:hypothetical protein